MVNMLDICYDQAKKDTILDAEISEEFRTCQTIQQQAIEGKTKAVTLEDVPANEIH